MRSTNLGSFGVGETLTCAKRPSGIFGNDPLANYQ